jgi:hypothetical protein
MVNTINPTSIGYGFWWGLWEGLGWLDKKLDQIKHAMQHNMDEQNNMIWRLSKAKTKVILN